MANYSTKELPTYGSHQCPKCKAKIPSYEGDAAPYIACASCNTFFQLEKGALIHKRQFTRPVQIAIPIGTKGVYKNKKFQVVGALNVKESNASYYWTEYILKCEDGSHDFMSEYEGHWNFVHPLEEFKREKKTTFYYKDREYTYFNYYKTTYVGVAGEFDWDISKVDKPMVKEYISPPYGLNNEKGSNGDHWFETEYLSKSEVRKIFSLPGSYGLPYRSGGYSNQPFPLGVESYQIKRAGIIFILAMLAIVFLGKGINDPQEIYNQTIPLKSLTNNDSNNFVSEPFVVSSLLGSSAVDIGFHANVSNNWMEASFTVINEETGEEFFFDEGVEYYFGYTGGEHWTEGNLENYITLSALPDGKYRMIAKPILPENNTVDSFSIKVIQGVTLWSNFFILTLLGLVIPLFIAIWESIFNSNKWGTSNLIEHE